VVCRTNAFTARIYVYYQESSVTVTFIHSQSVSIASVNKPCVMSHALHSHSNNASMHTGLFGVFLLSAERVVVN